MGQVGKLIIFDWSNKGVWMGFWGTEKKLYNFSGILEVFFKEKNNLWLLCILEVQTGSSTVTLHLICGWIPCYLCKSRQWGDCSVSACHLIGSILGQDGLADFPQMVMINPRIFAMWISYFDQNACYVSIQLRKGEKGFSDLVAIMLIKNEKERDFVAIMWFFLF